jgi:hypothetical protein
MLDARATAPRAAAAAHAAPAAYVAAIAAVLALGAWLYWPTLDMGLFADDYAIAAARAGTLAARRGPLDLFDFGNGTLADTRALQRLGSLPWWAVPDLRISFMRPLSSALVHLDAALFGRNAWAQHAHSIVVWALLALAASALYRRLLGSRVLAVLATAFFALDQSQHMPVEWLCNRGGLYAMLFGVLGLHAHLRHRAQGGWGFAWLSALCLAIALLFGEWGLPVFAYLLAYELAGSRDAPAMRVRALLPAALLALAFLLTRAALGYGARGSDVYVDPADDPAAFALLLLHRLPVFAADIAFNLPAGVWNFGLPWRARILELDLFTPAQWSALPGWHAYHVMIGMAAIAVMAALLRFVARGLEPDERLRLRFLVLGAVLSLLPVAGSFPSTRLTLAASLGAAPAFALVLRQIARRLYDAPRLSAPRFLGFWVLGAGLLYAQLISPLRTDMESVVDSYATTTAWVLAAELDPRAVADQRVYVISADEFTTTFFFAYTWWYSGRPLPRSFVPLSVAPHALDVERSGERELLLRTLGGGFLASVPETHFRSAARPLGLNAAIELDGVRVEVARTIKGQPQTLRLRFDRSLDDPQLVLLFAGERGLVRVRPPALGQMLRLPHATGPSWYALVRGREEQRFGPPPDVIDFDPEPKALRFAP